MSPPDRTRVEDAGHAVPTRQASSSAPAPDPDVGPAPAAILATQRTAGNRAVAAVLGGDGAGVQRAPTDDPSPADIVVGSQTVDSAAPRPRPGEGAQMQVSSKTLDSAAPRPSGGQQQGGSAAARRTTGTVAPPMTPRALNDPRFAPGAEFGPKPTPAGMFGNVPKPASAVPDPVELKAGYVEAAYQRDPSRVIRSPSATWHEEAWDKSNGFKKFGSSVPVPEAFTDGSVTFVAPDYRGSASTLPRYAATGGPPASGSGGGTAPPVVPGGSTPPGSATERPMARLPQDRTEARQRQAVAPDIAPNGPWGSQVAQRVTYQEVAAAYARDPGSVVRSPNDRWHGQGYRTDGGKGGTPGAFKVGDQYVVSPGYPIDNLPYLSVPGSAGAPSSGGATRPGPKDPLPQAAQTIAPGGTTYAERSTLKSHESTTTDTGGRTETRTRSREQGVVTTATEVSEGGMTNRKEQQRGVGLGVGGNLVGITGGSTDTTRIDGDVVAAKQSKQVTAGLGSDLKLGAERTSTKETVIGTDPDGNPVKTETSTKVGGKADLSGWELGGGAERTNQKGTKMGAGGGVKGDWKGNIELEAYLNLQTKGGLSFKPTVSRGVKVEASDPIEVDGGFEVVYRIIETTSAGASAGKSVGGGGSVGVSGGISEAEFRGGRRKFKDKNAAKAFQDDAAARVTGEQALTQLIPPTTVAGALQIPVGETRTSGDISGSNVGASAGYGGVAINVGTAKSTTQELTIKRTGPASVEVTGGVTGSKTGSVGISAPVLSHGYSSTNSASFAVTFEFDLSKEQGRASFELYCRTGIPPMQAPKMIEKAGSDSDHETVTIPGLGSAVWTGSTWQVSREAADGSTTKVYGGSQQHEQTPGIVGKLIGDDTLKSNAQIVRVMQNGEEVGARAQLTVGGTSGDYNRKEFGKIFMGAKTDGDVKPSGEWTVSAPVPKESIRALEQNSRRIRNAMDEREAYSDLVKEGGAQMLGGQVGMSSKDWDLELKGDSNFPGEKERTRLKELRKSLMARIRSNPEMANDIVRETGEELAKLAKRREAVADLKRYTDLPDGLRKQQLGVIDMHVDDIKVVRRTAQAVAMKRNAAEKATDVAARVDREEKAGPARTSKRSAGDGEAAKADREYAALQDQVSAKEARIAAKRNEIRDFSKALGDAIGAKGTTALKFGADTATAQVAIASGKGYIGAATDADKKQAALDPQVERLRDAWSAASERKDQLAAIKALERVLDERLKLMESCLYFIREAGKSVFHITTRGAKSGNPAFWNSLGEAEGEE